MPGQLSHHYREGAVPVRPARFIPPLPADIPIMPGQIRAAKAARRLPVGLIVFLVLVVLGVLLRWSVSYSDYDKQADRPRRDAGDVRACAEGNPPSGYALGAGRAFSRSSGADVNHIRG